MAEKSLAIIPARGGSKGIPRKNIQMVGNLPLIAYTIRAALHARNIDRVLVSTDDEEMAEISRNHGAEVPFLRPCEISGDRAAVSDAVNHMIEGIYGSFPPGLVVTTLYPTHPFRTPRLLDELLEQAFKGYGRVITVKRLSVLPLAMLRRENGLLHSIIGKEPENALPRFLYRPYGLASVHVSNGPDRTYVSVIKDKLSLIDIDTMQDLRLARKVVENGLFDFGVGSC